MQSTESPVIIIVGTRPEGIKMAPVYHALKRAGIPTLICSTMQHDHLLEEVLGLFDITPDINLQIMRLGQDLFYVTQSVLQKTKEIFLKYNPCLVLVQGDTTSSMTAALSAFYLGIPIGHVEAGLRTDDPRSPFPEEMNRRLISVVSTYHFSPTPASLANVLANGAKRDHVFCTGNTVVDALQIVREKIQSHHLSILEEVQVKVQKAKQKNMHVALLTVHRRESFEGGINQLLKAIKEFAQKHNDVFWVYPYHPNPHVINAISQIGLSDLPNMYLCEPVAYKEMVYILDQSDVVLTDSGGIQEEAVSLGKPVLVLREKTERMEGVLAGCAQIVGFEEKKILDGIEWALFEFKELPFHATQIYGDGHASEKIVAFIQSQYELLQDSKKLYINKFEHVSVKQNKEGAMEKVCVVGLGYIGLPTSIVLAEHGYTVIGFDTDENKVNKITEGNPVIHEPEIYEKLQVVLGSQTLKIKNSIVAADYFIIAVPTPITEDKKTDLQYVMQAAKAIASVLKKGDTIIIESTISVGTTDEVASLLEEHTQLVAGKDFFVAHCPERVLPGKIFSELISNDRIIGGINRNSSKKAQELYTSFVDGELILVDAKTAEMVKLVENSSRDVELAFAHQVASMAYSKGLNPYKIIELANKHPRVNILKPTIGVGGHCIAIDPWFLIESFPHNSSLLKAAREVNDAKPFEVLGCIDSAINKWFNDHKTKGTVLLLGATYKADIDDIRESPALQIINACLQKQNANILVCEPHLSSEKAQKLFGKHLVNLTEGISKADIIVVLVGHKRFTVIDRKSLENKIVFDFCGSLNKNSQHVDSKDNLFWPACSMMDFFIANHTENATSEEKQ